MASEEWDYSKRDILRRRLLEALKVGRLALSEAESMAIEAGFELNPSAQAESFHPEHLKFWSMAMALSWAAFRSISPVRAAWQLYRDTQYTWQGVLNPGGPQGWELKRTGRASVFELLEFASPWDDEFAGTYWDGAQIGASYRELQTALALGEVTAIGRDLRRGQDAGPVPIPTEDWSFLQLLPTREAEDFGFELGIPVYRSVLVDRVLLLERFAPVLREGQEPVAAFSVETGAPGRPSSMHIVTEELARRIKGGPEFAALTVIGVARELHDWFKKGGPKGFPIPKPTTIKNALASEIREAITLQKSRSPEKPA